MFRGGTLSVHGMRITNEETSPGIIPEWLLDHLIAQLSNDKSHFDGGKSRILVIYPNTESRREIIDRISEQGYVVDNTLHHTIPSLMDSVMSDFRMPQKLSHSSSFQLILHEECKKAARNLMFPVINPLPEMNWSRGKTIALSELHSFLSSESLAKDWNGPGIGSFRKILKNLELKFNITHDDFLPERLIERLNNSKKPFSLLDVDGIVMLNHSPTIPKSHVNFMKAISHHCPIHQLGNIGNIRLGFHGLRLIDDWAITDSTELPNWIPKHELILKENQKNVERVVLNRENQSFEATYSIISDYLLESSKNTVLIVDPNFDNNKHIWRRGMKNLGLPFPQENQIITNYSTGHWLHAYMNLSYKNDAFSLEKLRALSLQKSILLFPEMPIHPVDERIRPIPDSDLLTKMARTNHILGGPGALFQWLRSLSLDTDFAINSTEDNIKKESTQWWLICISKWLNPLLSGYDKDAIQDSSFKGVFTNESLPLPPSPRNGDEWIRLTIELLCERMSKKVNVEESITSLKVLQSVSTELSNLRSLQFTLRHNYPKMGPQWIEEISTLIHQIKIPIFSNLSRNRVRILSCDQALGCTADVVVLANTSSNSWDLRVPKMHFIGDGERYENNLLRPDGPIRNARHNFQHILSSAPKVYILDSELDDSNPPSTPIREWSILRDYNETFFETKEDYSISPRRARRTDGLMLNKNLQSSRSPINPASVTLSMESLLQRDRERRQPIFAGNDGYLAEGHHESLFSFDTESMWLTRIPKQFDPPRVNTRWPVISGITINNSGRKVRTLSIDPRPFTPKSTGIKVSDSRNGYIHLENKKIQYWSPSRLETWLRCPRSGWLSKDLRVGIEENQKEDLDARTHGDLFHKIHHNLLLQTLNFNEGVERKFDPDKSLTNISSCGIDSDILMQKSLSYLNEVAPWLNKSDAVSTNRIRIMTGMSIKEWDSWILDQKPKQLGGRIGNLIKEELLLENVAPIAIEWEIRLPNSKSKGIEISLPANLTLPNKIFITPIILTGKIDRVDLVPFDKEQNIWIDECGSLEVAPIELHKRDDWSPRRLVIIRDIKTTEKTNVKERHYKGILEELQLALYARAWEIAHPGDLVIGTGISTLGHKTSHFVELSMHNSARSLQKYGIKTEITMNKFRFSNENKVPISDPFRAWLASRLSVALNVSNRANLGFINPIPDKSNCKYCPVSNLCEVKLEGDY